MRKSKERISLQTNSYNKILDKHLALAELLRTKYCKTPVKVPKNSKFLPLETFLPKDFEWIKTRKRLNVESEMQHHCVWTYGTYINKDKSAIYSYVDNNGDRWTIEFQMVKNKFTITQIQGKYDQDTNGNKKNIKKIISNYLETAKQA